MCFFYFWMLVGQLLELSGNSTCPFPDFSRNCSLENPEHRIWNHFGGNFWLATSIICLFSIFSIVWLVLLVESLCLLSNLWWLTSVSGACCQTTAGIGNNAVVLAVSGLSHAVPEWRRGVPSLEPGLQPGHFQFYWSVCLVVDFDLVPFPFTPRRRSVCSIGFKIAFHCGVDCFAAGLTRLVDSSWFSMVSVVCTVGAAITGGFVVVGVRVCLTTVIITNVVVTGTIFVGVALVFLSFLNWRHWFR